MSSSVHRDLPTTADRSALTRRDLLAAAALGLAAGAPAIARAAASANGPQGQLTYGECFLPGKTADEVLISCHVCHPSLCNDNLSGIALSAFLAKELKQRALRYSYRFIFIPGTIGAITWLALNEGELGKIKRYE